MKRKSLLFLLAAFMCSCLPPALHAAPGDSQVARWKDDKTACFLLMFDDSMQSAYQVAIPEMMRRGMIGTLYVNPGGQGWTSAAQRWEKSIPLTGMVYGDHTWDHANTSTLQEQDDEIRKCQEKIMSVSYPDGKPHLISYGQPGVSKWFSYGAELTAILAKYNLISRPPFNAAHGSVFGVNTIPDILALADSAISKKGMEYLVIHGLQRRASEGDPDIGFQDFWAFDKDTYRGVLDGLKSRRDRGDLWITDHISCYKYQTERDNVPVFKASVTPQQIQLTLALTGTLNVALCDEPLTIKTQVPPGWKAATVTQDSRQMSVPVVSGTIQYDAMPNAGAIMIKASPLPVVTVRATTPDAYETGAVPGAFAISTTGAVPVKVNYTIAGTGTSGGLYTTGTDSGRYTIPGSPLSLGASSGIVKVMPISNAVYEGEQSVLISIAPGTNYLVGTGSTAIVTIHDRTDIAPADWYLQKANGDAEDWNTTGNWWSQPKGGTKLTGYSRATVADRFHTNGFELRGKNAYYPAAHSFYGNNLVLDGTGSKITLPVTVVYNAPQITNSVVSLTSYGGSVCATPASAPMEVLSVTGTFDNLGTTTFSSEATVAKPLAGLSLRAAALTGTGKLILTNGVGTSGTEGTISVSIANASNFRGTIAQMAGTLKFQKNLTSSGPLTSASGSAIVVNDKIVVGGLTVGAKVMPAGTYTATQLNGSGVLFSGSGTITTIASPASGAGPASVQPH